MTTVANSFKRHKSQRYSTGMDITSLQPSSKRQRIETPPNNILLMTVLNPLYPIVTNVVHTICSPYGNVDRIVIFRKNGVQAMVEFDSVDSASLCKDTLNGADIYSGSCTLRIEYSKTDRLNVYKNDADSWDYTQPDLGLEEKNNENLRPALLPIPTACPLQIHDAIGVTCNYHSTSPHSCHTTDSNGDSDGSYPGVNGDTTKEIAIHNAGYSLLSPLYNGITNGITACNGLSTCNGVAACTPPTSSQGCVLMIYGLDPQKINCEKIFNLFCLYGNVCKVKFLKTKPGSAMVQMGEPVAIERVISNLRNCPLFSNPLQLQYSKQAFLADVQYPFELPDGTPSFQDFRSNKNNRFNTPEQAVKNRIQPPSKVVHFFNSPPNIQEEDFKKYFLIAGIKPPKDNKVFPPKNGKPERSSSGLMEFHTLADAVDAVCLFNHTPISSSTSKYPYIIKLCFSSGRSEVRNGE